MAPSLGSDTRFVATLVLELALMVALLRYVFRGRRPRALAVVGFALLLGTQVVGYDIFVALPDGRIACDAGRVSYTYRVEVKTRLLGIPRLRVEAVVWDPEHAFRHVPHAQFPFEGRGESVYLLGEVLTGVDRVFVLRHYGPDGAFASVRVAELEPSLSGHLTEEVVGREIAAIDSKVYRIGTSVGR